LGWLVSASDSSCQSGGNFYIAPLLCFVKGNNMLINICKAKIHRATLTDANLHYEGSITIDRNLMDAAGIYPYEKVSVVNVTNGSRLETYVIEGKPGAGDICLNGAAAHHGKKGDIIIIIAYAMMEQLDASGYKPCFVKVDGQNKIVSK